VDDALTEAATEAVPPAPAPLDAAE
jgi:hypothetical protein